MIKKFKTYNYYDHVNGMIEEDSFNHFFIKMFFNKRIKYSKSDADMSLVFRYPNTKFDTPYSVFICHESCNHYKHNFDLSISYSDKEDGKNIIMPNWLFHIGKDKSFNDDIINNPELLRRPLVKKTEFCNFIHRGHSRLPGHLLRVEVFKYFNSKQKVASPGPLLNNCKFTIKKDLSNVNEQKYAFQDICKFTLCFENLDKKYYNTEKLYHASITNTIPIYWGSETAFEDFNKNRVIYAKDYKTFGDLYSRVEFLNKNPKEYNRMLNLNIFKNKNVIKKYITKLKNTDLYKELIES